MSEKTTKPGTDLALIKKDVVDVVAGKVKQFTEAGELHLPANYSPDNAMKSAFLILQDTVDRNKQPVLSVCTKDSIANSLLSMCVQGLNPGKQQGYFLAYGKQLVFQRSYFGAMAVAKMVDPSITDIVAEVIYKSDTLKYSILNGKKTITEHLQDFGNIDSVNIIGAYAMVIGKGGIVRDTVLSTMDEIKQAWKQSQVKPVNDDGSIKKGSTHDKFTADMAKKTVINKLCKPIINSSSDQTILGQYAQQAESIVAEAQLEENIAENANKDVIDIEPDTPEPAQTEAAKSGETSEPAADEKKYKEDPPPAEEPTYPRWFIQGYAQLLDMGVDELLVYKEEELPKLKDKIKSGQYNMLMVIIEDLEEQKIGPANQLVV